MSFEYYSAEIGERLNGLVDQLAQVRSVIEQGAVHGTLFDIETGLPQGGCPKRSLSKALGDLDVPATNTPGTSNVNRYVGYFACSTDVVVAVENLNHFKRQLAEITSEAKLLGDFNWRDLRRAFNASGHAKCHALHATREVNIVDGLCRGISFTVAKKIQRNENMSLAQTLEWLEKAEAWDVVSIIHERGYDRDTKIRYSRPVATHIRANVFLPSSIQQLSCSLPLVVDKAEWDGTVKFNIPDAQTRKQRSDVARFQDSIPLPFIRGGVLHIVSSAEAESA